MSIRSMSLVKKNDDLCKPYLYKLKINKFKKKTKEPLKNEPLMNFFKAVS